MMRSDQRTLRWAVMVGLLGVIGLLAVACGGDDPTPTPRPTPTSPPADTTPAWEIEWNQLLEDARAEGQVVVRMGGSASRNFAPRFEVFENETGIKVIAETGRGSQQVEKVKAEREAGIFSSDVWMTGVTSSNNVRKLGALVDDVVDHIVLPDVADTGNWLDGHHWLADTGTRNTIFAFCASPSTQFAYNTDLVDASELDSYWDLIDGRFAGQIVGTIPWEAGQTNSDFYINTPALGEDYIRKVILDSDVLWVADGQQGVDLLAFGEKSIMMYQGNSNDDIDDLEGEGLPVRNHFGQGFAEGGVISLGGACAMSLFDTPANPAAQTVFFNWWMGADNLFEAQGLTNDQSLRVDVPSNNFEQTYARAPGIDYFFPEMDDSIEANIGLAFNRMLADDNGLR